MSIKKLLVLLLISTACNAQALIPGDKILRQPAAAFVGVPREEMRLPNPPYTAVGRLRFSGHLWCTATLISRDLILTAAHCLFASKNKMRRGPFRFEPATWLKNHDSSMVTGFWWGTSDVVTHPDLDFAVLRLEQPLGDIHGWMQVQPRGWTDKKRALEVVSYSDDFKAGRRPSYQKGCRFTFYPWETPSRVYKMLGHSCAGFEGSSGASLFYIEDNQAHILAINVRGSRDGCPPETEKPCRRIPYDKDHANAAIPAESFWPLVRKVLSGET